MTAPCDQLELYLDGELDLAQVDGMRAHLPTCPPCQARMEGLVHLEAMTALAYAGTQRPREGLRPPRWAMRRSALSALTVGLAAGVVGLLALHRAAEREAAPWMVMGQHRGLEARLSYEPADRHRPYMPMRSEVPVQAVPQGPLARLEEQKAVAGIAAAFLLHGDRQVAAAYLDQLPPSPERECDLAAVALASGEAKRALELAENALTARPGYPQALWNRALALRDLGRPLEAAEAFRELAGLGEPGWSQEAAERAKALAGTEHRQ